MENLTKQKNQRADIVLEDVLNFYNGKSIKPGGDGLYNVFGSNGVVGKTNDSIYSDAIILGRVGAYCGSVMYSEDKFWPSDNTIVVKPKNQELNYFYYYLLKNLELNQYAGGAAQPLITHTIVKRIKTRIPSDVDVAKKISLILRNYDKLILNNNRQIEILEEIAQVIYKEKFFNNNNSKWEIKSILDNNLFKLCKSRIKKYDGQKEYFDTASIDGIKIIKNGEYFDYNKKPSRAQIQPVINSVWFARMKNTYKVLVYNALNKVEADNSMLSSGMVGFLIDSKYLGYLFFTINSQWFHEQKDQYATGATQVSLTNEGLAKIKLKIPDTKLVEEYSKLTNPIVNEIILLLKKNKNLIATRDLMLPKLMSGEIEL